MPAKPYYSLAVAIVFGCAGTVPDPSTTANTRRSNILRAEEIAAAHADNSNTYDAISRLRPNWLVSHGLTTAQSAGVVDSQYALVFVNGQSYGDLSTLRTFPAYQVAVIQYYDITQAGARFGIKGGSSGVIDVTTKSGP